MVEPKPAGEGLFRRCVQLVLENIAGTIISLGVVGFLGLLAYFWAEPGPITFDFQAEQRCPSGKLTKIQERLEDPNLPLTNGADRLTICDTEALETVRSEAPRALASNTRVASYGTARD